MQKIFTVLLAILAFSSNQAQTILWGGANDPKSTFTGGLAASGWTTEAISSSIPDSLANTIWEFSANGTASKGAYWGTRTRIQSPTGATGAMLFNSDYLDNRGVAGNFGNGPSAAPHSGALVSPIIDCSTFPSVAISFHQFYRAFQSTCYIETSSDGGTTWDGKIQLNQEIAANSQTANAVTADTRKIFNLSSFIAGKPNVKIRFTFEGEYYFWLIDDVTLISVPENDLKLTSAFYTPFAYAQPKSQICGDLFSFSGTASNIGSKNQSDIVFKGEILDLAGKVLFADSSSIGELTTTDVDSPLTTVNTFDPGPLDIGKYYIRWSVYSKNNTDFNFRDNMIRDSFEVTDFQYQRESRVTGGSRAGGGAAYTYGCLYKTSNCWGPNDKFQAESMQYNIGAGSATTLAGFNNTIYLFKVNSDIADDWSNFERSGGISNTGITMLGITDFTFTNQANYQFVDVPLKDIDDNSIPLEPNTRYFVMVETADQSSLPNTQWHFMGVNNSRDFGHRYATPVIDASGMWFDGFSDQVACVRFKMKVPNANDDIALPENSINIAPNPVVTNQLRVSINLEDKKYANLTIFDQTGRVHSFEHFTEFADKVIPMNVSELPNGEYFIRVSNDHGTRTKKFVVLR